MLLSVSNPTWSLNGQGKRGPDTYTTPTTMRKKIRGDWQWRENSSNPQYINYCDSWLLPKGSFPQTYQTLVAECFQSINLTSACGHN
jgi:hypothetical protein